MDALYAALDAYHLAINLAKQKDIELEAICCSHIGKIFYKALKKKDKARTYFYDAVRIGMTLRPKDVTKEAWYKKAEMWLDEIRQAELLAETEAKQKEREPFLK